MKIIYSKEEKEIPGKFRIKFICMDCGKLLPPLVNYFHQYKRLICKENMDVALQKFVCAINNQEVDSFIKTYVKIKKFYNTLCCCKDSFQEVSKFLDSRSKIITAEDQRLIDKQRRKRDREKLKRQKRLIKRARKLENKAQNISDPKTKETKETKETKCDCDDYYDYDDYHVRFKTQGQIEAEQKNGDLIEQLAAKRNNFVGIGTNKAKRRLNKLALSSCLAKVVRSALEIEDKNIQAKKSYGKYRSKIYESKHKLIGEVVNLFRDNNWIFGIQESNSIPTSHIIYFEIPECEQISWHFNYDQALNWPIYEKEWDGKINSTMDKLEKITLKLLSEANLL